MPHIRHLDGADHRVLGDGVPGAAADGGDNAVDVGHDLIPRVAGQLLHLLLSQFDSLRHLLQVDGGGGQGFVVAGLGIVQVCHSVVIGVLGSGQGRVGLVQSLLIRHQLIIHLFVVLQKSVILGLGRIIGILGVCQRSGIVRCKRCQLCLGRGKPLLRLGKGCHFLRPFFSGQIFPLVV